MGLKFPNDLVDRRGGRKIGGILVEVSGDLAVVGIGINIHPREWPAGIEGISVGELIPGVTPSRIEILERLLIEVDRAWSLPTDHLDATFAAEHAPTGGRVEIRIGEDPDPSTLVSGRLLDLDPRRRLLVEADQGLVEVPVDRARILSWTPHGLRPHLPFVPGAGALSERGEAAVVVGSPRRAKNVGRKRAERLVEKDL